MKTIKISKEVIDSRRLVVVLGAHRSGTSAIARALKVIDVDLGENLMPESVDNPKGFFEDLDIYQINVDILEVLGINWDSVRLVSKADYVQLRDKGYVIRAVELLRDKMRRSPVFGIKDPRLCVLLPFWQEVFTSLGVNVRYILASRHPRSVAVSLAARNGMDIRKAYLVWAGHTLCALSGTIGHRPLFLDYDRLISSPESEVKRMSEELGLPINSSELIIYKKDFLTSELRHSIYEPRDLFLDPYCPTLVAELFADLVEVAADTITTEDKYFQDKLSAYVGEFDRLIPELSLIDSYHEEIVSIRRETIKRDEQMARLVQTVFERDAEITQLGQTVFERDSVLRDLNELIGAKEVAAALMKDKLMRTEALISERDAQLELLSIQLSEVNSVLSEMETSTSWKVTAPCRIAGYWLREHILGLANNRIYYGIVDNMLLLPAALVYYGGFRLFLTRLASGSGAFSEVIERQSALYEMCNGKHTIIRSIAFGGFACAVRIKRAGGINRSIRNLIKVIRGEGLFGVRTRIKNSLPQFGPLDKSTNCKLNDNSLIASRRILVSDYRIPQPDVSAGEKATLGIIKDLCALGYEVVFLPNDMLPSPKYEPALQELGVQVITREKGFDYSSHYIERHGHEFGAFYLIRVDVAETLLSIVRRVAPTARVIFHAPDLYFLRELREAELTDDTATRRRAFQTRERELAMMSRSDRVVLVSPAEVPVLNEVLPDTPISVFPVLYAPVVDKPRTYSKRKNIFFLGGFAHPPNISAVQWFASEVWPLVHKALPRVEFHIIGAEAPDVVMSLDELPGIKVVGYVPELNSVLQHLRVGVAPLQYGAGIKGKVAVTMGAGIPCVCTEIAAEGMGIVNNVHALVENDPVRFAQAIVTLYKDKETWSRLARNGRVLVQDKYGDAANRSSLLKVLDEARMLPISLFIEYCQTANPVAVPNPSADCDVDVSIIVPVYNKWHLTRACLTSVVQTSVGSGVSYEIILADDGSTDETIHSAELFPGLRYVRTKKNLGFLRNCNNAAKHARGQHILLLNNDTVVLPGWLENLYHTMQQDTSNAIVGSKLLYPDGLIQEAGAALFADGTAINVGRGFSRYTPFFNISREVDYISGASILIRKSFWDSVGGFDENYKTAYCEDSDLAMTARASGMRVVYEYKSEVIHFEHQSYADQAPSYNTTLQDHNIAILLNKWRSVLERDHLKVCDWQLAASRAERTPSYSTKKRRETGRLNILYFSPFPSHPPSHGNRSTILRFGQYFKRQGHNVNFVLLQSHDYCHGDVAVMAEAWDTLDILPFSNPMVADGREIPFDSWYEEGLGERIRFLCDKYDTDMVFCSYVFQSKLLEFVPDYILKVIDTHDKMGNRYEMLRKNGQPLEFFSCTPEEEGTYLRRADVVVARREEEACYFDLVSGQKTSIVVPHVEEPCFQDRCFDSLHNAGIVASANRINLTIVRDCLEAIDRTMDGNAPPFTVHVAGEVKEMTETLPASEKAIFNRPWVKMLGFVPDIGQFYSEMDLVISPVTMGTGINVKTVQAMAYGMPLLTTECGVKGIETGDMYHLHPGLDQLALSLISLVQTPKELGRLAIISRSRYTAFYEDALAGFNQLTAHPLLTTGLTCSLPEMTVGKESAGSMPECKVCKSRTDFLARVDSGLTVGSGERFPLGKTGENASYWNCPNCGFVFTELCDKWSHTDYLRKIYNEEYIKIDPDYVEKRPKEMGVMTTWLLGSLMGKVSVLDYGAGNKVLVDLLIAEGVGSATAWDPFSSPMRPNGVYNVITCYAVLEHISDPCVAFEDFRRLLSDDGVVLISTHLVPKNIGELGHDWWYIGPRNGHISFYSANAMAISAKNNGFFLKSITNDFHVLYSDAKSALLLEIDSRLKEMSLS